MNDTKRNQDGVPAQLLIEGMARYLIDGKATPVLEFAEQLIGKLALRHICITLLSWLKSRDRLQKIVPMKAGRNGSQTALKMASMKITEAGSDQAALIQLLNIDSSFNLVFVICDDKVQLHESFSRKEIDEILDAAGKMYNPLRFSTVRRTV